MYETLQNGRGSSSNKSVTFEEDVLHEIALTLEKQYFTYINCKI